MGELIKTKKNTYTIQQRKPQNRNINLISFFFIQNQDLARFTCPMIANDERVKAVFELEPKEEIFRSFNFHHKSIGTVIEKKEKQTNKLCTKQLYIT